MGIGSMKMPKLTLHAKIVLWSSLVVGIILIVFSIESILLIRNKLGEDVDHRLESEAHEIIQTFGLVDGQVKIIHEFEWEEPHHVSEEDAIYILYADETRKEIIRSKNYLGKASPISSISFDSLNTTFKTHIVNDIKIRFAAKPFSFNETHKGWLITGMTFDGLNHVQNVILGVYAFIFPLAMLIAFLGSSVVARKALEPVLDISETVRHIHSRNLDQELNVLDSKDEIAHLADTINDLLKRLRISFKTIRQFTANASHELKIPLSIVKAELDQLQKVDQNTLKNESLERTKLELNRMAKLIGDLSTLAKTDTKQIMINKQTVWLNDIIHDEIERYRPTSNEKNIALVVDKLPSVSVHADPHWMQVLASNLLDNAIKFSPNGSTVNIHIIVKDKQFYELSITDNGPGIQDTEIENVTRRFYRSEPANNISGSGLGLSIVEWVAKSHGGEIVFKNNDGGGLTVTLTIPK